MAYRDGSERLLVRNQELEAELSDAHATIRRLRGQDVNVERSWMRRILGGTSQVDVSRSVAGTLRDDAVARVVDRLDRRFDVTGQVSRVGRRVSWSLPRTFEQTRNVDVVLTEGAAGVDITIRERVARLGVITHALLWSLLLPFGFATLAAIGHLPSLMVMAPLFLLSVLVARAAFGAWARHRQREMCALAEGMVAAFTETDDDGAAERVRVTDEPTTERQAEHEAEAIADAVGHDRHCEPRVR